MKYLRFVLAIILMVLVVVVIVQNHVAMSTEVTFRFDLFALHYQSSNISIYSLITIAFLFGVVVTGLYGMIERFRLKKEIKGLRKTATEKDTELNSLRNLPITSDSVATAPVEEQTEDSPKGDV
jgi:uncharacterized membrane protein YciS (DUF1049 family)